MFCRDRIYESLKDHQLINNYILRDAQLKCACWGDPHCISFDNVRFDFQGKCKYDLVSTRCYGKQLPANLVPFNIKQRQTDRSTNAPAAWVEHLEVNVFGNEYRLMRGDVFKKNGFVRPHPYSDLKYGIEVFAFGTGLILTADFGLKVKYDSRMSFAEVSLCSAYRNNVCGLCGNADGNMTLANEFVDR